MSGAAAKHEGEHGDGGHKKHKKHHHAAHPEHEHEEGWIVSFADNVLLMMGFFVILLAMNMGPKGTSDAAAAETAEDRLLDVAIAVREAFHNPVSLESADAADQPLIRRLRHRMNKGDVNTRAPDGESQSVQTVRPSDWAGDGGYVQFAERSTLLDEGGKRTIAQIAEKLVGGRWVIEVRGHASKWETWRDARKARDLSYERAYVVGYELTLRGVAWNQIRLVSCGDAIPVAPSARTSDEAQTNQRTEIMVLNETVPNDPYNDAPVRSAE
jgi:flagellar motor protein MotB